MSAALVARAVAESAVLWLAVCAGWLLLCRLEARAAARRELAHYRARVWR